MPETAALNAVPFPLTRPVNVVLIVMTGVEVEDATVPAKPFAEATETSVTVPDPVPLAPGCPDMEIFHAANVPDPCEDVTFMNRSPVETL